MPGRKYHARRMTIEHLNALPAEEFVRVLGSVFEHSPWVAERVTPARPFPSRDQLHRAMTGAVSAAPHETRVLLVLSHPDLSDGLSRPRNLTSASHAEQAAAGLDSLTVDEASRLAELNTKYRERFGFPFVICARNHDKSSILGAIRQRLKNEREEELATALGEIGEIARHRLEDLID